MRPISLSFLCRAIPPDFVRLDQDILSPLAGKKQLYTYETLDFWEQIKTPGSAWFLQAPFFFFLPHFFPYLGSSSKITWPPLCTTLLRMSLKCSGLYLSQFRCTSPHLLATGDGSNSPTIVGDVFIHPSAKVHATAKVSRRRPPPPKLLCCKWIRSTQF